MTELRKILWSCYKTYFKEINKFSILNMLASFKTPLHPTPRQQKINRGRKDLILVLNS